MVIMKLSFSACFMSTARMGLFSRRAASWVLLTCPVWPTCTWLLGTRGAPTGRRLGVLAASWYRRLDCCSMTRTVTAEGSFISHFSLFLQWSGTKDRVLFVKILSLLSDKWYMSFCLTLSYILLSSTIKLSAEIESSPPYHLPIDLSGGYWQIPSKPFLPTRAVTPSEHLRAKSPQLGATWHGGLLENSIEVNPAGEVASSGQRHQIT